VASLSFSVVLSRQQRQIDRLIEENAIMAAELRELRWDREPRTGRSADRPVTDRSVSAPVAAASAPDAVVNSAHRGAESRNH
jgi:hypothetical protein